MTDNTDAFARERQDPARRDFLRLFGLLAAGVAVGPYVSPAMASFAPPASLVGSNEITFYEESRRFTACDGPACDLVAGTLFSLNSSSFKGTVLLDVQPTVKTTGWVITASQTNFKVQPGEQHFFNVFMDCYSDPQVGATPQKLMVRVTATGYPLDGSAPFVIGTLTAKAECVLSALQVVPPTEPIQMTPGGQASATVMINGAWIDSAKFGPVELLATFVPAGWTINVLPPSVTFAGSGSVPAKVRVQLPGNVANGAYTFRVLARMSHESFVAPMTATGTVKVVVAL